MATDKIDELYDALKADGIVEKDRQNFRDYMLAPGKQGYENRLQLYNALKADELITSPTYEEFGKRLGLVARKDLSAAEGSPTPAPAEEPTRQVNEAISPTPAKAEPEVEEKAPEASKGWQPTMQQRLATAQTLNGGMTSFRAVAAAGRERTRRAMEKNTPQGRGQAQAAQMQARMAGLPTQALGIGAAAPKGETGSDAPSTEPRGVTGKAAEVSRRAMEKAADREVRSLSGPVAVGMVPGPDGKPVTQWELPDGTLTTDFAEADRAAASSRRNRLAHEFTRRMEQNGLDPGKREDVEAQARLDAESVNRQRWETRMQNIDSKIAEAEKEVERLKGVWDSMDGPDLWQAVKDGFNPEYGREGSPENYRKHREKQAAADAWHTAEQNLKELKQARERFLRGEENEISSIGEDVVSGLYTGGKELIENPLGLRSGGDAFMLQAIRNKVQNGETLTPEEKKLVESVQFANETEGYSKGEGATYQVARFVPEALEMAMEFMAQPGSGLTRKVLGKTFENGFRSGVRRLASDPRLLGRATAAAVAEGASVASTTQLGKNLDEASGRTMQAPIYDDKGNIVAFEGDSMAEAMLKTGFRAVGSNAVFMPHTNLGKGILRWLDKGKVGKGLNDIFRNASEFLPISNPLEGLAKIKTTELFSVGLGDQTFGQWADPEQNAILIGSLLASEFAMGTPGKVVQGYERYNLGRAQTRVQKSYEAAKEVFSHRPDGEDILRMFGEAVLGGTDKTTVELLSTMMKNMRTPEGSFGEGVGGVDARFTREECEAVLDMVRAVYDYRGREYRYNAAYHPEKIQQETSKEENSVEDIMESDVKDAEKDVNLQGERNSDGEDYGNRPQQDNDERTHPWENDGGSMAGDAAGTAQGISDRGDIRMYEEGLVSSYNEHSEYSERDRREAESERLVGIARANGQYRSREEIRGLGERREKATGESEVVVDINARRVYKIKDPYAKSPMKGNVEPEDAIFEHLVHNRYFPETAYRFEGISDDAGDVRIVLSQEYFESYGQPTQKQIDAALAEKGLKPEGKYTYGNEEVSVTDVTGDNALVGADGKVYFIDPVINFKKPVREILGEAPYPQPTEGEMAMQEAEQTGYNMTGLEERQQAMRNFRYWEGRMEELFGHHDFDEMLEAEFGISASAEMLDALGESGYNAEERTVIADYLHARETFDAVFKRISDDQDAEVEQQNALLKKESHEDGYIRPATLKGESGDAYIYIVKGNVVPTEDGRMINTAASDDVIYIYDPTTVH